MLNVFWGITVSGYMLIMSEPLLGNKSWHRLFCHVKNSSLECFKRPGDESPEVNCPLQGLVMDPSDVSKHPLAYRLSDGEKTKIYVEVIIYCKLMRLHIKPNGTHPEQCMPYAVKQHYYYRK